MKKLILIDSNALVHRAFHALPPSMTSPKGAMTNAVYGFTSVFLKMLKDLKPDYIAATFDLAGPTHRHEEFAEYKAHREKAPDELYAQIPPIKEMLKAFGVPIFEKQGLEADDLIGSLAEKAKKQKDIQVVIVTGDMDTLQLVEGEKVVVFTLRKGMSDTVIYDEKGVKERYGLKPEQVVDFKGLKGDPSDNIPGVKGIGDKTASALIQQFGSIEKMYEALEKNKKTGLSPKMTEKLTEGKDMALFSKKLATIIRDADIDFKLEKTGWKKNVDRTALDDLFRELGFNSLKRRVDEALSDGNQPAKAEPVEENTSAQTSLLPSVPGPSMYDGYLIGHDIKPYLKGLIAGGKELPEKYFDTRVAAWLLRPDARNYDFEKVWEAEIGGKFTEKAEDLIRLKNNLWDKLKSAGLVKVFEEIEMPLMPVLAKMELAGIAVDVAGIKKLLTETTGEIERLEKEIYKLSGEEFNINSPQQLGHILFEKLGIKGRVRKTGGGALSTAAGELDKIADEHPVVAKILEYRELAKLRSTYIEPFPALVDRGGRIHTTYNQTGSGTGRLASQNPNLQNIPIRTELGQEFRKSFVAGDGYALAIFDYSQIELRLVAHVAQDEKMLAAFRRGEDIHTRTAAEVFEVTPENVTKDMRRQAKALNFGLIYGMGVLGFARSAGVDRTQAREFIDRYFEEFSGVARLMEETKQEAYKKGYVQTIFGRRRPLPDIHSSMPMFRAQAERMAINHPIQGTAADLIKMAMIEVQKYIEKNKLQKDVRMLLQVHDELVFEIREGKEKQITPEIKRIMENVHKFDVPIVVDMAAGPNWADVKRLN